MSEVRGYNRKVLVYPSGLCDVITSNRPVFRDKKPDKKVVIKSDNFDPPVLGCTTPANFLRSMRRARARFRQLALANDFEYFVTLTLDQSKIDRYDPKVIVKALSQWCNNMVKRYNLSYILIPERHKDGALHFHGFFKGEFKVVDSGHVDRKGHTVFNLPQWSYGFTTAIKLYGEYAHAVSYCCKYVGKQGQKPAGRWYYSGGSLVEPTTIVTTYLEDDYRDCEFFAEIDSDYFIYLNKLIEFNPEVILSENWSAVL